MKTNRVFASALSLLLIGGFIPAHADDAAAARAATVAVIQTKYVSVLDADKIKLTALKAKMKVEPSLLKQVNSVILDFDTNYAAIVSGLANPDQAIQAIIDLCEEEVEEFGNSIYQLELMAKKIKTITCIKGKTSKSVSGLAPKCPTGYIKK